MRIARIAVALLLVLCAAAPAGCASSEADQKPQQDMLVRSVTIPIEGMACDACAARIQTRLAGVEGVLDANVSFDGKRAAIRYNAHAVEPERIAAAISGLGFTTGTTTGTTSEALP
jgi:copper chaperone CopZ